MTTLFLAALLGCGVEPEPATISGSPAGDPGVGVTGTMTGPTTSTTPEPQPTTTWACRDSVPAEELNGSYPAAELPPPDFVATAHNGQTRSKDDLLGHVTVMWFYPAASTGG